ncbi:MAG: hypothetical protein OQJ89_16210 [Kangiellaceae bacterium]|nr:hypothetical protein [Kangiellaceae bacterium]MCW8998913.1 hypothetical protein [Kangiellaceae bacterium]MCW9018518.1 hypothetical protein [Kangiellaceae bacterium]
MSEPMTEWDDLQNDWQSYQPDIQKLKKKINWVTWRMYLILVMDVVILIAYFPFVYFITVDSDRSWLLNSWHYLMAPFLLYGVYMDFKIRLPILRNEGNSTRDVLELYLKRIEAGERIGRLGKIFCWLMLAAFWIWVAANAMLEAGDEKVVQSGFMIFGTLWIGGIMLICIWYERKKRREYKELKPLWQDYLD